MKLLLVGLLVIALGQIARAQLETECRIYSDLYKQYMYAKYKFLGLGSRRGIYLWRELAYGLFRTALKTEFNDKDPSGIWLFEPVPGRPNTYFIRNRKYNEDYLRGSEKFQELIFKKNRAVFAEKLKNQVDDESFMWRFERVPNTHLYHIWNVKFNQALYTREYRTRHTGSNNQIETKTFLVVGLSENWPETEQFEWLLRCRDNVLPAIDDSRSYKQYNSNRV